MRNRGVGIVRRLLFAVLVQFAMLPSAGATCLQHSAFVGTTVSIARYFDGQGPQPRSAVIGIRGTGWFLSPRRLVTAAHVAEAMRLSRTDWKDIEIGEQAGESQMPARILRIAGPHSERVAVLELMRALAGAEVLPVRAERLEPDEPVISLAYPGGRLRFAGGRFVRYAQDGDSAGAAFLEMYDGNDRLVLDHGASGAPVLDCDGKVVAVVSMAITQTIAVLASTVRTSTAWQTPNVVAIPIRALLD